MVDEVMPVSALPSPIKVVLLGIEGVGKTSILYRWRTEKFMAHCGPTIAVALTQSTLLIDGVQVSFNQWDPAGDEHIPRSSAIYLKGAQAVLLVYDVCSAASFRALPPYLDVVREQCGDGVVCVLVGNKSDQIGSIAVRREEAESFAQAEGTPFLETSALHGTNLDEIRPLLFRELNRRQCPVASSASGAGIRNRPHGTTKTIVWNRITRLFAPGED
jgi:small GTP-binding protein